MPVFHFATVQGQNIHWFLKRNCSVTPAQLENACRLQRAEFNRDWVRVEPGAGDRSLIELSGQGRRVSVGRFVRPELRPVLAQEIRRALREVEPDRF